MNQPPLTVAPAKPADASPGSDVSAAGSWWGASCTLLSLLTVVGLIALIWWQSTAHTPDASEHYYPISNGISLSYRMTHSDGSISYRARNIERLHGSDIIPQLDVTTFSALLTALGIDIKKTDPQAALAVLSATTVARLNDVDQDDGSSATHTTSLLLMRGGAIGTLTAGSLVFDPPLPLIGNTSAIGAQQLTNGLINAKDRFTATFAFEAREAIDTPLGRLDDCVRVRRQLLVGQSENTTLTWYCAGIGVARQETGTAGAANFTRLELIGISTMDRTASVAPPAPLSQTSSVHAHEPGRGQTFPQAMGGSLAVLWSFKEEDTNNGIATPPLPVGDLLLYGTFRGRLVALDRSTRTIKWRFQTGAPIHAAPTVAAGLVYVGSADRKLYALDFESGAFRWAFATHDAISASPAIANGLVYLGSEDRNLYALDARTGVERWHFNTSGPIAQPPAVINGVVYIGSDDGALYALDGASGAVRWAYATGDAITTPPAVLDGVVYVGSHFDTLHALKADTQQPDGELLWRYKAARDAVGAALVVSEGMIYTAYAQEVRAVDATTGIERWRYRSSASLYGAPVLMADQLFINRAHSVLVLDARTGVERSITPTSESSGHAGLSSDGQQLFVGFFDGLLQVLGYR